MTETFWLEEPKMVYEVRDGGAAEIAKGVVEDEREGVVEEETVLDVAMCFDTK